MKLSNLKQAHNFDVRDYLKKRLDLTNYQSKRLYDDDFPRHSPFYIFEYEKQKNGGLIWRLTMPLILPYYLLMIIFVFIKWLITGNRYFNEKSLKFHRFWMKKLGIDWM